MKKNILLAIACIIGLPIVVFILGLLIGILGNILIFAEDLGSRLF